MTSINTTAGNNTTKNMYWVNLLSSENKHTFDIINNICQRFDHDTIDYLSQLQSSKELQNNFSSRNWLSDNELELLFLDDFFPSNISIVKAQEEIKKHASWLLEYRETDNILKDIRLILTTRWDVSKEVMSAIDILCKKYDITLPQLLIALNETNLNNQNIWKLKKILNQTYNQNLRKSISKRIPDLDRELCKFHPVQ